MLNFSSLLQVTYVFVYRCSLFILQVFSFSFSRQEIQVCVQVSFKVSIPKPFKVGLLIGLILCCYIWFFDHTFIFKLFYFFLWWCRSFSPDAENPGNNLYVTGLSPRITKRELEKHFATEGKVCPQSIFTCGFLRDFVCCLSTVSYFWVGLF